MCTIWIWIVFFTENEERINILTDFCFFCFIWANLEKKPGDLRWFASQRVVECLIFQLEEHRGDATVAWVDTVQRRYSALLCHTINATRETETLLPFPSAVISPPFILPPPPRCFFSPPAIYNYDARGEEELSLQIGDTVHILEKYEGEIGRDQCHVCVQSDVSWAI